MEKGEKRSNLKRHSRCYPRIRNVFLNLINNETGVDLNDFFKFVAATDRIPMQGFGKPIETFFVDTDSF